MKFEELIEKIDLIEYVIHKGYILDKNKSSARQKVFKKDDDVIVILNHRTSGNQIYYNPQLDADKGNIINFLLNRLNGSGSINFSKSKEDYRAVSKILHDYLNIPVNERTKSLAKSLKIKERSEILPFEIHLHNCKNLRGEGIKYLKSRDLTEEVISHPIFKDRILQAQGYDEKEEKNYNIKNVGFPYYYHNRIVGLEMRNENFKAFGKYSNISNSFWLSDNKNPNTIFVGEAPIDCISHFQLTKNEKILYAASGGSVADGQLVEFIRLIKDNGITNKIISNDNDKAGAISDFKYISTLAREENISMKIMKKDNLYINIDILSSDNKLTDKSIQYFDNTLKKYNDSERQELEKYSNDKNYAEQRIFRRVKSPDTKRLTYFIPHNKKAINFFNNKVISFLKIKNVQVLKPIATDWNQQLKDSINKGQTKNKGLII
jgi:hypothetical protein